MMKLPRATYNFGKSVAEMFSFSGISHKAGAKDGEIYDMKNISLDDYPCLTVRKKRQLLDFDVKGRVYGIGSADKLFWCADDEFGEAYFYYDGEKVFPVEKSEKTFAVINKYICIFPDKKYFSLWDAVNVLRDTFYTTLTELYEATKEEPPKDGEIYAVGGEAPFKLFQYNSQGTWKSMKTDEGKYIEQDEAYAYQSRWIYLMDSYGSLESTAQTLGNSGETIFAKSSDAGDYDVLYMNWKDYPAANVFRVGDVLELEVEYVPSSVSSPKRKDIDLTRKVYAKLTSLSRRSATYDYAYSMYFAGASFQPTLSEGGSHKVYGVQARRVIPDLEFAFCHENRIWGIDDDKICASKLGDPFNFQDFSLLADASWTVAVASSGPFTGGCVYNGYPTFFKEDSIIRVAGNYPSQYSTYETNDVAGVLKGSKKSLAIANGALFYLSPEGIARYTGSYPSIVSDALGKVLSYGRAGAGADKYYLEAIDEEGEKAVYVLDTKINAWTKEEALFSAGFTDMGRELYALGDGGIYLIDSERELFDDSETIESFIEFAPIYEGSLKKKGLSKLLVNLSVKDGSEVRIYLSYDGGEWILMKKWSTGGIHTVPLTIKRCGNYRIRISGEGEYKLLALSRERYLGSERG